MPIQVNQEFPHCERCGKMVHTRRGRIVAATGSGPVIFCSELCRDEHDERFGLTDRGHWLEGDAPVVRGRR
jgi:hypothetical protein